MADIKISELPEAAQANATDLLEASQGVDPGYLTRKITLDQVSTLVAGSEQVQGAIDTAISEIPPDNSALTAHWRYETNTTPPPAGGKLRFNTGQPPVTGAAITLWLANTDNDGLVYTWTILPGSGDAFIIRTSQGARLDINVTSATISVAGPGGYLTVNGTVADDVIGTINNNTICVVSLVRSKLYPANAVPYADAAGRLKGDPAEISYNETTKTLSVANATLTGAITSTGGNIIASGGYVSVDRTGDAVQGDLYIGADAGFNAGFNLRTGPSLRWILRKNATAEAGANAGSDLEIISRDDAGAALNTALTAKRSTGYVGLGASPVLIVARLHARGTGQITPSVDTATSAGLGSTVYVQDQGVAVGNGGMVMFGAGQGAFATIKGHILSGANNTAGDLVISTRRINTDATLTETARFKFDGSTTLAGALTGTTATFSGEITAATPATADNDTTVATTAFVKAQGYAPLASPIFTGNPTAPTPTAGDNDTSIATTAFVTAAVAAAGGVPPATVVDFAGAAVPTGWLLCDGAAVSRATYSALYTALGGAASVWGQGNGTTTFNVPDLGGRVTAGKEAVATRLTTAGAGIDGATLGAAGGTQTHTLDATQNAAHTHGITDAGHQHNAQGSAVFITGTTGDALYTNAPGGSVNFYYRSLTNNQTTGISIQSSGIGAAHQNTQPTVMINKIIKT